MLHERARRHAALGDEKRLLIVDHLAPGDRTVSELSRLAGMPGNLLAHHLDVLEEAGLIERRVSQGDHRRRYVALRWDELPTPVGARQPPGETIAFVCTANSARSQFAAALWRSLTGAAAFSAGSEPASAVHPLAVRAADEFGVDLSRMRPSGYETLPADLDLVISVCDRARETGLPEAGERLHWSIPDPAISDSLQAFQDSFTEIAQRIERLSPRAPL